MIQTQTRETKEPSLVSPFPAAAPDVQADLEKIEIPASREGREGLRKQLEKEIRVSCQEREFLESVGKETGAKMGPEQVSAILTGRIRAMNPFRDFDKVGFSIFLGGEHPWTCLDLMPGPILYGMAAGLITGMAVGHVASAAVTIPAVLVAMAPIFLPMWGARTIFNLVAGVGTLALSPIAYLAARIFDEEKRPGYIKARAFLADLKRSLLGGEEQKDLRIKRVALLGEMIAEQEKALESIEAADNGEYPVNHGDIGRLTERYLDPRHFTRVK